MPAKTITKPTASKTPVLDRSDIASFDRVAADVKAGNIDLRDYTNVYSTLSEGKTWPLSNDHMIAIVAEVSDKIPGDEIANEVWFAVMQNVINGMKPSAAVAAVAATVETDDDDDNSDETDNRTDEEKIAEVKALIASGDWNVDLGRVAYKKAYSTATTLTDEQIMLAYANTTDDDPKLLAAEMLKLEPSRIGDGKAAADAVLKGNKALSEAIIARAKADMTKAAGNETFNALLEDAITADDKKRHASTNLLIALLNIYAKVDDMGEVTECEIDGWPVIGSKLKNVKPDETNKVFDEYEYTDDNNNKISGSWSEVCYSQTPHSIQRQGELTLLKVARDANAPRPAQYKDKEYWTDARLAAREELYKNQERRGLKYFRDAISLRHKMVELATDCPDLGVGINFARNPATLKLVRDANGSPMLEKAHNSIFVWNKKVAGTLVPFTVKSLLNVDTKLCAEKGGTVGALAESVVITKRTTRAPNEDSKTAFKVPQVTNLDELSLVLGSFVSFFDVKMSIADRAKLKADVAKKGADKDFVQLLGDAASIIKEWYSPAMQRQYAEAKEAEAKEAEALLEANKAAGKA